MRRTHLLSVAFKVVTGPRAWIKHQGYNQVTGTVRPLFSTQLLSSGTYFLSTQVISFLNTVFQLLKTSSVVCMHTYACTHTCSHTHAFIWRHTDVHTHLSLHSLPPNLNSSVFASTFRRKGSHSIDEGDEHTQISRKVKIFLNRDSGYLIQFAVTFSLSDAGRTGIVIGVWHLISASFPTLKL